MYICIWEQSCLIPVFHLLPLADRLSHRLHVFTDMLHGKTIRTKKSEFF